MVSYLASHFCSLAKYAAAFFRNSFSILALRSSARSLLISADSLRKPSSPLGGGMIPAVPAHPVPHGLGRQIIRSRHRRDRPVLLRDLTHNLRLELIRVPHSRHNLILSRRQNTGSPLSEKNHSLHINITDRYRHEELPSRVRSRASRSAADPAPTYALGLTVTAGRSPHQRSSSTGPGR